MIQKKIKLNNYIIVYQILFFYEKDFKMLKFKNYPGAFSLHRKQVSISLLVNFETCQYFGLMPRSPLLKNP